MAHNSPKWVQKYQPFADKPDVWIFVPSEKSRKIGHEYKTDIEKRWHAPPYFYHSLSGGHVRALKQHLANTYFARFDLKRFFSSISRGRITRVLKPYVGYEKARQIAIQSTVLSPSRPDTHILPFGFVQSSIIASVCLDKSRLGSVLRKLSRQRVTLSVYVDDIIVSARDQETLSRVVDEVEEAARLSKFEIHSEKKSMSARQIVAFNIELSNNQINLTDTRLTELINNANDSDNDAIRRGIIDYIKSINEGQFELAKSKLNCKHDDAMNEF